MKLVFVLAALVSASAAFAAPAKPGVIVIRPGSYTAKHEIGLMFADDAKSCNENDGVWESDMCVVKDAADTIDIKVVRTPVKKVEVTLTAVGTNIHTCELQGESKALPSGRLLVSAETEVDGEDGNTKKDVCKLIIGKDAKGLNSTIVKGKEDACATFCGANVSLEIYGAK